MKIAIIGGGASGLVAAISSARKNARVTLFERNSRVGKKILMTGNGKCNLSNINLSSDMYYTGDRSFVMSALEKFGLNDSLMFFNGLGLLLTEKRGGIYPHSEQASAVLDALRFEADSVGVLVKCDCYVKDIKVSGKGFEINYDDSSSKQTGKLSEFFDRVIISTGGKAAPGTGSDGNGYELAKRLGHSVTKIYPALCGVKCEGDFWKSVAGVRCQASLIIENDVTGEGISFGELQFTDYGISGIPVFQISRILAGMVDSQTRPVVDIDLVPDVDEGTLFNEITARVMLLPDRTAEQILCGILNKKIAACILKRIGMGANEFFTDNKEKLLGTVNTIKHFRVTVKGINSFDQSQTTAGGVPLNEINGFFESRFVPGLFITGEILDVDGVCGGYNLQWAWSSGYIAGEEAAQC